MLSKNIRYVKANFLRLILTVPLLLALGSLLPPDALAGAVPKADCGPNDRVETGLQGQTTQFERTSGASEIAYNCNLELVGQFEGEGASWQFAWFDDCGYYDTANSPLQQRRGTVVIDASDPAHPQATAILDDAAMLDPWESLKVNKRRKLLGGTKGSGGVPTDRQFAFYDVSDCAHPKLLSVVDVPDHRGHAGDFAPDGLTYYGTGGGGWTAMDISDPSNPRKILRWVPPDGIGRPHDLSISDDGTRMYVAQPGRPNDPTLPTPNGLVIVDVSDIQFRRPNPQVRTISTLFWRDGSTAQVPQPVRIKGKPYIVFVDELGSGFLGPQGPRDACAQGLPPFGMARIIDISDERNPKIISRLMLEIHDPANCSAVVEDNAGINIFGYDSHYCTVDNPNNAKLVGCGHFGAGLRVFDIRDPYHPKEIAYYKPPARRREVRPGSNLYQRNLLGDRTIDWASSNVRFVNKNGEYQIWFTSQDNGFQIVRFTNRLLALTGLEFDQDHPGNRN
jgi:hypothetical protein